MVMESPILLSKIQIYFTVSHLGLTINEFWTWTNESELVKTGCENSFRHWPVQYENSDVRGKQTTEAGL